MVWSAKVRSFRGALIEVTVAAPDCSTALALFKQLYGERNVAFGPWRTVTQRSQETAFPLC